MKLAAFSANNGDYVTIGINCHIAIANGNGNSWIIPLILLINRLIVKILFRI